MICKIEVKNFKRFRTDTFEFLPDGLSLIAGGNNSGKSSILHALALLEFCRRVMESKHGRSAIEASGVGSTFRTTFKDFTPLMVPDFRHLWTNLRTTAGAVQSPIVIRVTWVDRAVGNVERHLEYTLDLPGPLRVITTASNVLAGEIIPRVAYLPPFAGMQVKEAKLGMPAKERLLGQGLSGAVLRNHLCELERQSRTAFDALRGPRRTVSRADRSNFLRTDAWRQLLTVLNEEFKCMVYPAERRPRPDGTVFLKVNLTKGTFLGGKFTKFPKYTARDLVVEGSGFLQWISVFSLSADRDIDVLLLDEADVHLHPTLQGRLLFRLSREAVDKRKQVLYVTHSTEVLRKADYRSIYYLAENSKGYLGEETGKVKVIEGLGSLYVPRIEKLHRTRRLLLVEGTSDLDLLKIWATTLGVVWPENLVEWYSTGKPSERKTLFFELNKEVVGLHAISLRDRDDESPDTTAADLRDKSNPDPLVPAGQTYRLQHRKWRRRHIENYLLLPEAIARAAQAKGAASVQDVIDFLQATHSATINSTFVRTDCAQAITDLRAKEITYEKANNTEVRFQVSRFDIARAMEPAEICDDVKALLSQIVELCR